MMTKIHTVDQPAEHLITWKTPGNCRKQRAPQQPLSLADDEASDTEPEGGARCIQMLWNLSSKVVY